MNNEYPFSFDYPNLHANYITRKGKGWAGKPMKKETKIIFVDVDDVCARLSEVWLGRYNKDYNDNLTDKDLTDWNIDKFVKPECGLKIYHYLKDPGIYDEVVPRDGSIEGVNILRELGYKVLFATSCPIEVAGRKFHWLKQYDYIKKERDYIEIRDKSLLKGEYMLDDSYDNVSGFTGYSYLLTRPWNKNRLWYHRVIDWNEFISIMKENAARGL